jgi:hypothetical protein
MNILRKISGLPAGVQKTITLLAYTTFWIFWTVSVVINFAAPTIPNPSTNQVFPVQEHETRYVTPFEGWLYDGWAIVTVCLFATWFYLAFGDKILSLLKAKDNASSSSHDP